MKTEMLALAKRLDEARYMDDWLLVANIAIDLRDLAGRGQDAGAAGCFHRYAEKLCCLDCGHTREHTHPQAQEAGRDGEDDRILWGIVANAGRLSDRRTFRWCHVAGATGLGSQSSIALCRRFGFDPDEQRGGDDHDQQESSDGE